MTKWMQFPLLSLMKVATDTNPNKFVIVNFRVAIEKKQKPNKPKSTTNHNQTNTPLPSTFCEPNSPEIAQHLIPVTQIIVSLEWYQLLSITTRGLAVIVLNKPNPKVPFPFVGKVKSN